MKKRYIIIPLLLIILSIGGFTAYKFIEYRNSDKYKLEQLGYTENEIILINKKMKDKNYLLENEYNKNIIIFLNEKRFKEQNLESYLNYYKEKSDYSINEIVAIINIGADKDFYESATKTDLTKGNLILLNKFHYLDKNFIPENLVNISSSYSYEGNRIKKDVYEKLIEMFEDAKKDSIRLIVTSGYRSYESQEKLYKDYVIKQGQKWADMYAARAGFSEHQTGLALDIIEYGLNRDTFENSKGAKWLYDNAHKYGFIIRYKKDTIKITGYEYEPWHFRFVGEETASKVKKENLTYEEYYEYYLK